MNATEITESLDQTHNINDFSVPHTTYHVLFIYIQCDTFTYHDTIDLLTKKVHYLLIVVLSIFLSHCELSASAYAISKNMHLILVV